MKNPSLCCFVLSRGNNSLSFLFRLFFVALFSLPVAGAELVQVDSGQFRFSVSSRGAELWDKRAEVAWRTSGSNCFGSASIVVDSKVRRMDLANPMLEFRSRGIELTFHPLGENPSAALRVRARAWPDSQTLEISYRADASLKVESISLFPDLLAVSDQSHGYVLVPAREGLLIPADSGLAFEQRFDTYTYEGCHMQMIGAVKNGAAALVTWNDPYIAAVVKSATNVPAGSRQLLTPSSVLRKSADAFRIHLLGKGDYLSIGKAYRKVAESAGWLVTWDQKLKGHPERAGLFGAANIKLWSALDRRMNEDSTKEESVRVNWTFDEAAQVAEHLKRDLQLEKVLFTVGGWIHRGYDNQHPDILPTAPECGGDAAFSDMSRRVMGLGYLLCLHDNYQDIYRDSPSWDEKFVMKTPDGKLARGGHWAGGTAWLTCSKMALELARRPQNLSAVKNLCAANSYFIDTTYASGLQECFDPAHPLSRGDDMKWKQALSDYAREVFGIFGSECGREWAIPHSDFFEGLTGVSGTYYHDAALPGKLGATVIPLFEMVYRDCIAMYGKYGYDPQRATEYVLHHISIGRPLNYHSIPPHLYWIQKSPTLEALGVRPGIADLKQVGPRQFQVSYRWAVEKSPGNDWNAFVHFTDRSGAIKFQNDFLPVPPVSAWPTGQVSHGPFTVTVPAELSGTFNVRMGLFQPASGERALLQGRDNGEHSYLVGRLTVNGDKVEFQPSEPSAIFASGQSPFTRSEGGWAEGLHPMDRFIKNTHEILGPLNEITSRMQMTGHEFLTSDRQVRRTVFGQGAEKIEVTVNMGQGNFTCSSPNGGVVTLPANGFLIDSAKFVAFYAGSWAGEKYENPALFTIRSLDKRPISRSKKVRIYHGFGSNALRLNQSTLSVPRELTGNPSQR